MTHPSLAQAQTASPTTTGVMVIITVKPGVTREQAMAVMPAEIRQTVQLYLDGKISQWFGRADGRGVVFVINANSVADAKAITDTLPLVKAGLASFEFIALTPLTPLSRLLTETPSAPKQ